MFSVSVVMEPAECAKAEMQGAAVVVGIEYSNTEISRAIDDYIHSDRDRQILKSRLIDGLTSDELSDRYHLSARRVKTIVYKAQEGLFKRLG